MICHIKESILIPIQESSLKSEVWIRSMLATLCDIRDLGALRETNSGVLYATSDITRTCAGSTSGSQ